MRVVKLSSDFGIIVKKEAIRQKGVSLEQLFQIMETSFPFDENETLISFGPHFGKEATNEFIQRLEHVGLIYGKEFLDFHDILPNWCCVYVKLKDDVET